MPANFQLAMPAGNLADRPTDNNPFTQGRYFAALDTGQLFRDNGTGWDNVTAWGAAVAAHFVLASDPGSGSVVPSMRALVAADIPGLPTSKITSGTFADALLALMTNTRTTNTFLAGPASGAAAAAAWRALSAADMPVLIDTADQGYFWGGTIYLPSNTLGGSLSSANQVRVMQFVLPFPVTIGKVSISVSTGAASALGDVGIYDISKNLLVHAAAAMDLSAIAVVQAALSTVPYTLPPGKYWLAWTANSASPLATLAVTTRVDLLLNANASKKLGTAANASVSGVLPATLGAITAAAISPIVALFER